MNTKNNVDNNDIEIDIQKLDQSIKIDIKNESIHETEIIMESKKQKNRSKKSQNSRMNSNNTRVNTNNK